MTLICVSLFVGAPASAHHSFAKFDRQRSVELEGGLIEVRWQNPHVTFELRGRGADGQVQACARDELARGSCAAPASDPSSSPWAIA